MQRITLRGFACWCISIVSLLFSQHLLQAAPELPADPRAWVNSRPLSLDALEGKAVIFYFFEEECPRCMEKWPPMLESSAKFQGEPVIFIGVNSGTPRRTVESYARKVKIPWPIIVDSDRSLEKAFGLTKEISLENIFQMKVKYPDGRIEYGNPGEFEQTVNQALKDAKWRIDPKTLPEQTLAAWKEVELGDYQRALPLLRRILSARNEQIKSAAEQLEAVVMEDLKKLQDEAATAEENEDIWEAYKTYSLIATRFKGYEGSKEAAAKVKEYARHDDVKVEQTAFKKLELAKRTGNRGDERSVTRAIAMLKALIEEYPDSDAAAEAKDILAVVDFKLPGTGN
jgi:thiol-disulfide isomerase/thioredoxin